MPIPVINFILLYSSSSRRGSRTLAHLYLYNLIKKVQVGKDQEKAQSEKDSHSKNRGGKKPN